VHPEVPLEMRRDADGDSSCADASDASDVSAARGKCVHAPPIDRALLQWHAAR